jgi:hypothetical protein
MSKTNLHEVETVDEFMEVLIQNERLLIAPPISKHVHLFLQKNWWEITRQTTTLGFTITVRRSGLQRECPSIYIKRETSFV